LSITLFLYRFRRCKEIQVDYVAVKPNGEIDITNLVELLAENQKTLVSLMHVNNEIELC
jgi:cysteine desulfurase